uniref:Uncharacterized protein n=1 Tax=Oryza nivara TaxID=4536 RepID=A0A0E0FZZ1_ORYNI
MQGERGTCDNRESTELCGRVGGGEHQRDETMGAKGIVEGIDTVELEAREYRQSTQLVECGGGGGEGPSRQEPPRCQQGQWSAAAAGKDFAGGNHHSVGEGRLQCSAAETSPSGTTTAPAATEEVGSGEGSGGLQRRPPLGTTAAPAWVGGVRGSSGRGRPRLRGRRLGKKSALEKAAEERDGGNSTCEEERGEGAPSHAWRG